MRGGRRHRFTPRCEVGWYVPIRRRVNCAMHFGRSRRFLVVVVASHGGNSLIKRRPSSSIAHATYRWLRAPAGLAPSRAVHDRRPTASGPLLREATWPFMTFVSSSGVDLDFTILRGRLPPGRVLLRQRTSGPDGVTHHSATCFWSRRCRGRLTGYGPRVARANGRRLMTHVAPQRQ